MPGVIVPPAPGLRIFHFNRLVSLDSRLVTFFAWWQRNGPFPLTIDPKGGLRTDPAEQLALFTAGKSRAKTLDQTPHGRGGAVDAWPARVATGPDGSEFVAGIHLPSEGDAAMQLFAQYGALAEGHSLEWGGRWSQFPDLPHVQVPNWQELAFPPKEQ